MPQWRMPRTHATVERLCQAAPQRLSNCTEERRDESFTTLLLPTDSSPPNTFNAHVRQALQRDIKQQVTQGIMKKDTGMRAVLHTTSKRKAWASMVQDKHGPSNVMRNAAEMCELRMTFACLIPRQRQDQRGHIKNTKKTPKHINCNHIQIITGRGGQGNETAV